jgi:ribosomal protein S18 acetylase RimI-like enzyme
MNSSANVQIERLDGSAAAAAVPALAEILMDCVEGGASVSFLAPLTREQAEAFWRRVAASVAEGGTALLVAREGRLLQGTVQVVLALPENQPHRGEVAKMLVHRRARRRGIAEALMRAAELAASQEGRTLLVLDTVTGGDAERLYRRLGWNLTGIIPDYALFPDRSFCDTSVYWKRV